MSGGGRGWLALLLAGCAVVGGVAAKRAARASPPPPRPERGVVDVAVSARRRPGVAGRVVIANPGASEVDARLTSLGGDRPASSARSRCRRTPRCCTRSRPRSVVPRRVEIFGGWAAVGWVSSAGGEGAGLGAEPCTPAAGAAWEVVDGVTTGRTHSFLVVMNPFTVDAVIDVALYLPEQPPVRSTDWTDLRIRAGSSVGAGSLRSRARRADRRRDGERHARPDRGLLARRRGARWRPLRLAQPAFASRWVVPVAGGSGSGTLSLLVPGDLGVRFGAIQLSSDTAQQPAGNLTVVRQGGASALSAPLQTAGPSAVVVQLLSDAQAAMGLRGAGLGRTTPRRAERPRRRPPGSCCLRRSARPRARARARERRRRAHPSDASAAAR